MSTSAADRYDYDLVVVGGGPVGENVADYAAKRGVRRVAVVESSLVGGECSYWACMPSKALLRSGQAIRAARRLDGARQAVTGTIDAAAVLARRSAFTDGWDDAGQAAWLASAGIDLLRGHGRLAGPHAVRVGDRLLTAGAVALATGSVPVLPDVPGLASAAPWGTREATAAAHVPPRLLVVGGGVAGVELALAYSSLGSRVILLSRSGLLDGEEPFVGEHLAAALAAEGVDVRLGVQPTRVDRDQQGVVGVTLEDGAVLRAEEILVATGRRPSTDDLGLDQVGLDPSRGLAVDETMRVEGTDWLYAVGDVNGRALLTHQGKYQARAAGEAIAARLQGAPLDDAPWGAHAATADRAAVPRVVFTDPEVASVGLTEARAREQGLDVRAVEHDLGAVAGARLHADGYTGRAKIVVDEGRGVIVGATFVGQDVAELLHAATIAIVGEVTIDRLWHAVPAYPTVSEVWLRLLEAYGRPA
ncbi:pyridine nucleotide-disulfide oxidoreductase [Xylanimonas oleitrophica]|uniref:Pyridine nucleotide-disulfide oxidoreductase n=1 Tax=Xylanimonas oleitrophica TaxID=2607479 RepID=A0A2W5YCW0_9MICO|nr:NAD(P)/FAD-dependent oxidoreductase [Xylanimonas oleitrophica]PZR52061.1 pyridine nucleotide-disulfide oxidoreductase [Xylanimonas oleitrophica]